MCGIAGFVLGSPIADGRSVLTEMTETLRHRGPDGHGYWHDASKRVFLGHRRLAIVDLSENGAQPMRSASGRYTIAFNGEVYNFLELREKLVRLGHSFRGGSDTEVMLAAFEQWGVDRAVEDFVGMFAFAVWDATDQSLVLVRDRLGKKPLYYAHANNSLLFGSELKAVRAFPGFDRSIDRDAVALYMRHNYIPAPECIYSAAKKLRAGTIARFDCRAAPQLAGERRYWDPAELRGRGPRFVGSFDDAVTELESLLEDAVKLRMIADVPLGAFLSGGIDSSLVVSLMTRASDRPVKTFTIGFHDDQFDEARHAKRVAAHLETDHTELYVPGSEAMSVIPSLPLMYDEPFADSSQIPTFLVSKLARQHVTVALSGDGGDELACGYDRYVWMQTLWRAIRLAPLPLRKAAATAIRTGGASAIDGLMRGLRSATGGRVGPLQMRRRLLKLAEALGEGDARATYRQLLSHWRDPESLVIGVKSSIRDVAASVTGSDIAEIVESLMATDTANYLPDDVLVKVDRASMANSLEVRAPLLDHRLFEFARRLPLDLHVKGKQGKQLLRAILQKHVPRSLIDRPKMGFGIPLADWLRGPLREWASDLLSAERLEREGVFRAAPVQHTWSEFLAGKNYSHYLIWDVLMFQAWLDEERRAQRQPQAGALRALP
jgi:asparagine synthase (glutamine-hydrolysing)